MANSIYCVNLPKSLLLFSFISYLCKGNRMPKTVRQSQIARKLAAVLDKMKENGSIP